VAYRDPQLGAAIGIGAAVLALLLVLIGWESRPPR
jgi:hypothetical protein